MNKFFAFIISLFLVIAPVSSSNMAHASSGGGGVGTYANIILGMGNGIVGSTILIKCKVSQPSLVAYMAGSLIYIAAEIAGGNKKKEDVKSGANDFEQTKNSMTEGGDLQRAAIQKQLDNEKSNLEHAQKKKTWMMATLAVYAIATVLAVIEQVYGATVSGSDAAVCGPDASHLPMSLSIATAYVGANGYASGGLIGAAISAAMLHLLPKLIAAIGVGAGITDALVASLNLASGRIVFFLAATVLVGVVVAGLSAEEGEIQERIKKLEEALKLFDNSSNELAEGSSTDPGASPGLTSPGGIKTDMVSGTKRQDIQLRDGRVNKLPKNNLSGRKCFSSASGSMDYSEAGCSKPIVLNRLQINPQYGTPLLTSGMNASMDLANAVASGDTAAADVQAAKLASMAKNLEALKDNYVAKYNEKLKRQGQKPVNGKEEVNRRVAAFENELKKQGLLKANSFAEIDQMNASQKKDQTGGVVPPVAPNQEVITVGGDSKGKSEEELKDGLAETDESSLTENLAEEATLSSRLEEFEENSSEISKDGRSLFEQISNRYIHSLPRLLKRRQDPVPVETK